MLRSQTNGFSNKPTIPIHHNGRLIGMLIEEQPRQYRFTAADWRFNLLDGSRFTAPRLAYHAVNQLGRFVDQPLEMRAA